MIQLDMDMAVHLPVLRWEWGKPLHPTSVCRCPAHNAAVGGHPRSLHLTENPVHPTNGAMGIDIAWSDWPEEKQRRFCQLAWRLGWSIGLNDSFVHLDRRISIGLPQNVFTYGAAWNGTIAEAQIRAAA